MSKLPPINWKSLDLWSAIVLWLASAFLLVHLLIHLSRGY